MELEIQKLKEHNDIETARLRGNVDFWKEKVDTLIKSQKEMLESKTKLHLELEGRDKQLQDSQARNKQLAEEIETLQRQVTRQKYLAPQLMQAADQFTPHTSSESASNAVGHGLLNATQKVKKSTVARTQKAGYQPTKQSQTPLHDNQLIDGLSDDSPLFDNSMVVELKDPHAGNQGPRQQ